MNLRKQNSRRDLQLNRRKVRIAYDTLEPRHLLATFVVNSIADDASGISDGQLTLREALIAAETNAAFGDATAGDASGDVIRFAKSLNGQTISLNAGEFSLSDNVSIYGGDTGITINARSNGRIFAINSSESIVIRDLNLTGGSVVDNGGAILIRGIGQTTLVGLNVSGNVAAGSGGGAIALEGGSMTVFNSSLSGNVANGPSGSGGALLVTSGNARIFNSTISANVANRAGGGIEIVDGSLVLSRSTLGGPSTADGNIAGPAGTGTPGNGGGIHVTGRNGTSVYVNGGTVQNNFAALEGGGLWNQAGSTMVVRNVSISGNVAVGSKADDGGGGIFNNGGTSLVLNSTITGNFATGASGSGGGILSTGGSVKVLRSTVSNNVANRAGGGIELIDGDLLVASSTLQANVAGPTGTAAPGNGGALHVTGNSGTNSHFWNVTVSDNFAAREGGGLWNQAGSTLTVRNSNLLNNVASGDAADDGGGGIFNNGGTTRVTNSTIRGNVANGSSGSGGGIFSTGGDIVVDRSTIAANVANRAGGGLEIVDGSALLVKSLLGGRNASDGNIAGPNGSAAPGNGGGLHVSGRSGTSTIVANTRVWNNFAASEGGGLWNQTGSTMVVLNNSTVDNNIAAGNGADEGGGGIFNNGGVMNIIGSRITSNVANGTSGSGGGILSTDGQVNVIDSTISRNVANRAGGGVEVIDGVFAMFDSLLGGYGNNGNVAGPAGSAAPGNGGGLHVSGSSGTATLISNSRVIGNQAANEGGGLWNQRGSRMVVRDGSLISNNDAGNGGGGGILNRGGFLNVLNSKVLRNETTGNGGGISGLAGSDTQVIGSDIERNEADLNGGGLFNDGNLIVDQSKVIRNRADIDGGGLFDGPSGISAVTDTTFRGNQPN